MAPRQHEHRLVQNSAVFVPGESKFTAVPPPSPPSPSSHPPSAAYLCSRLSDLDLDRLGRRLQRQDSAAAERQVVTEKRLHDGLHVINTEAAALRCISRLYETDPVARDGFSRTVETITRHNGERGKLIITGVGKSGLIGKKLVATFNSLAIPSVFLHPTEALHGDLGTIGRDDALMFITFSGKTQELLGLIPHLDESLPVILLTSHTRPDTCEFVRLRPDTILLPAPVHEAETTSFGVPAPTTSTTVALAVGDAVAITAAKEIHACVSRVFAKHHPGGAIGASFRRPETIRDIATPWHDLPIVEAHRGVVGADVLKAGYTSKSGWVRVGSSGVASPGRIRGLGNDQLVARLEHVPGLVVAREDMLSICGTTNLRRAVDFVVGNMKQSADGCEYVCDSRTVLAVLERGEIMGVLEVGELLEWSASS
ncbi:related to arabinose 5-phosphate isomerase [Cephalotrichum gorgonifer]|uniref:Related to arabinose 5-phosphate isomerase n=1 Tax=Cephalotrichum gorgonifer TaxID=2041049 RepID=A0AAE8N891_9PEZI|nr:related to arabinose 5-phosphate isomerase [Cephalotrichum gorgonifer]